MDRRSDQEKRRVLSRGRRKGQKTQIRKIYDTVLGETTKLLDALNIAVPDAALEGSLEQTRELKAHLDTLLEARGLERASDSLDFLKYGLYAVQNLADCVIHEGRKANVRGASAREMFVETVHYFATYREVLQEEESDALTFPPGTYSPRAILDPYQPDQPPGKNWVQVGLDHCNLILRLLLDLWAAEEAWLRRLRKCGYSECRKPYFLDRAPRGHARFCSDRHKVAFHRIASR